MTPREWWLIYDSRIEGSKDDQTPQRGRFSKKERERLLALVDD